MAGRRKLLAELSFAWNTIVITIHFGARTMLQKVLGFFAGMHLRTVRTAVASEMLRCLCYQRMDGRARLHRRCNGCLGVMIELLLEVPGNQAEDNENDDFFHDGGDVQFRNVTSSVPPQFTYGNKCLR